jgi:inhibitor of KinA
MPEPFHIFPLGESTATLELSGSISVAANEKVLAIQQWLQDQPFTGMKDVAAAYSSVTVAYDFYEIRRQHLSKGTVFEWVRERLTEAFFESNTHLATAKKLHRIPVCYARRFAPDMERVMAFSKLAAAQIIELHTRQRYRVYLIGFQPGFSYLGEVDKKIAAPRLEKPVNLAAGSVGIAGSQTGIYPFDSPGGWNIIGRTPVRLFDSNASPPVLLEAGDEVEFYVISEAEFENFEHKQRG